MDKTNAFNAAYFRPVSGVKGWAPYLVTKDGDAVLVNSTAGFVKTLRDAGHTVTPV